MQLLTYNNSLNKYTNLSIISIRVESFCRSRIYTKICTKQKGKNSAAPHQKISNHQNDTFP